MKTRVCLKYFANDYRLRSQPVCLKKKTDAYDGAEVCELVDAYMLNLLSKKYNKNNFGFYRDDGFHVLKNKSESQPEHIKKIIQKIFKEYELDAIIQCNRKMVNYLDVNPNLIDRTYKLHTRLDNDIKYIHKDSNYPQKCHLQNLTIYRIKVIHPYL